LAEPFTVHVTVRAYETDAQGHLNSNVYLQYAEHARWELLRAAGIQQTDLLAKGVGPVNLETTIRFMRESLAGDELTVTCEFVWGSGKSFQVQLRSGTNLRSAERGGQRVPNRREPGQADAPACPA
jgi:acyl-CoA thioester hydrolase